MNRTYTDVLLAAKGVNQSELSEFLLLLKDSGIITDEKCSSVFIIKESKEKIATKMGIGIRQVERIISKCVEAGILKKSTYRGKYYIDMSIYPTDKQIDLLIITQSDHSCERKITTSIMCIHCVIILIFSFA